MKIKDKWCKEKRYNWSNGTLWSAHQLVTSQSSFCFTAEDKLGRLDILNERNWGDHKRSSFSRQHPQRSSSSMTSEMFGPGGGVFKTSQYPILLNLDRNGFYHTRLKSRYWGNRGYSGHRTPWKRQGGGGGGGRKEEYLGGIRQILLVLRSTEAKLQIHHVWLSLAENICADKR